MIKGTSFRGFTLILVAVVASIVVASAAQGSFVVSPERNDSRGFPAFFLKRFVNWLQSEIHFEQKLSKDQIAYVHDFASTSRSFTTRKSGQILRGVDATFRFEKNSPTRIFPGLRLFDFEDRPALRDAALKIIKRVAPLFSTKDLSGKQIGLGFLSPGVDLEILVWEDDLIRSRWISAFSTSQRTLIASPGSPASGQVVLRISKSKIIETQIVQLGVKPTSTCPAAAKFLQTDRTISDLSVAAEFSWHVDQFENLAMSHRGQREYERVWKLINLNPGVVKCVTSSDFTLVYP